jgi:hypothetical protein
MADERRSAASFIWPHLAAHEPVEAAPVRRERNLLAESMYPGHRSNAPAPPPPPAPRPKLTREQIFRDFSENMDPEFARLCGLIPTGRR